MATVRPLQSVLSAQSSDGVTARSDDSSRVVPVTGIDPRLHKMWDELFDRSLDARVHHHPSYLDVGGDDWAQHSWIAVSEADDTLSGAAVMVPKTFTFGRQLLPGARSSIEGVRLAGFGLLGADDQNTTDALVDSIVAEAIVRSIPVIELEEVHEDSPLWASLSRLADRGFRFVQTNDFDAHRLIQLPESADDYWATFKSKTRYNLRQKRKKFGDCTVTRFTETSDIDQLLNAAHAVSKNTWQTHQLGLRVTAGDQERRHLAFLAEQGALRSYVLFREEQPTAFVLGHQFRGVYHYDEVGFDRRLVSLSPGSVLLQEIIDDLFAHDRPDLFDFGLGDADYKKMFANETSRSATVRMFAPGIRGWWQTRSLRLRRRLTRSARALAHKTGVAARLRRLFRDRAGA